MPHPPELISFNSLLCSLPYVSIGLEKYTVLTEMGSYSTYGYAGAFSTSYILHVFHVSTYTLVSFFGESCLSLDIDAIPLNLDYILQCFPIHIPIYSIKQPFQGGDGASDISILHRGYMIFWSLQLICVNSKIHSYGWVCCICEKKFRSLAFILHISHISNIVFICDA